MDEEKRLKTIIAQGQGADQWLNHPSFKHVITLMKAEYIAQFEQTKFKDAEEREELWRKMQALTGIVNRMEKMIRRGEEANKSLLQRMKEKIS
jgi:hypothetical protein